MATRIIKLYETETSHIVREAISERCKYNSHGHSYSWEVCIEGPIGDNGMVLDFKQLADIKMMIDKFDHAHVFWSQEDPEVIEFYKKHFRRVLVMNKNVTAENMTRWAHNAIQGWLNANFNDKIWNTVTDGRQTIPTPYTCAWVRVWETKTGSAWTNESDAADTLTYIHKDEA